MILLVALVGVSVSSDMTLAFDNSGAEIWREVLPHDGSARLCQSLFSRSESDDLLLALLEEVTWSSHELVLFGRKVTEPRLSAWVADEGVAYTYSGMPRRPDPWSPTLFRLRQTAEATTGSKFNSVLANLYRSGDDAMGWHADDEPELGRDPVIASLSFGDERRFDFRHRTTGESVSVTLPHGSLLVMSGPTQANWKHRIARTKKSHNPRVNLTFRYVHLGLHSN